MQPAPGALNLASFTAAITALSAAVEITRSERFAALEESWRNTLIAGVVQSFEFTFELAWKSLKRQLERELPSPAELDAMNYRDLIRIGHERGLLGAVQPWFEFRELRNITAHTYARVKAQQVAAGAPDLLAHAQGLLAELGRRNAATAA